MSDWLSFGYAKVAERSSWKNGRKDNERKNEIPENHEKWKQILNAIEDILKHMGKLEKRPNRKHRKNVFERI